MDISSPTPKTKTLSSNDKIPIEDMDVFTKRTFSGEKPSPMAGKVSPMKEKESLSPVKNPGPFKL